MSCGEDVEIDPDIDIVGGHQVELTDGDFEYKYGLFNDRGQPTTEFEVGDRIVFSFWITNNSDEIWQLGASSDDFKDFFRVFKLEEPDSRIDMGRPQDGMFCDKMFIPMDPVIKFRFLWVVPKIDVESDPEWRRLIDAGTPFLWCLGRNAPPLEVGNYQTSFEQSFEYSLPEGQWLTTEDLSFSIDFSVK